MASVTQRAALVGSRIKWRAAAAPGKCSLRDVPGRGNFALTFTKPRTSQVRAELDATARSRGEKSAREPPGLRRLSSGRRPDGHAEWSLSLTAR